MRGRGAAWVLALVLLAGCAPAPAAEPPEEPEVRVRTHWEALETRAGPSPTWRLRGRAGSGRI